MREPDDEEYEKHSSRAVLNEILGEMDGLIRERLKKRRQSGPKEEEKEEEEVPMDDYYRSME